MSKVFVITGPSGVGKGTLISKLLERVPNLELSVSATTREPRAGDFLEFATYSGNRYGTLRSEVERCLSSGRSVVLEIEVQGARQVRAAMRESVQVFIAPPEPAQLRRRLEGRGTDSAEAIDARLQVAEQELAAKDEFPHLVVNDEIERAAAELEEIVRAELGLPLHSGAE